MEAPLFIIFVCFILAVMNWNLISSVWASCRYWRAVHSLEFKILHFQYVCFLLESVSGGSE